MTIVSYGGSWEDANKKAVFEPFTKETGVRVNLVPYAGLDKVKAMHLTRNLGFDIYMAQCPELAAGSKQGFWEPLSPALFDLDDLGVAPASDYVPFNIFFRGISWDPKRFGAGKVPTTFKEFFDLQKFPGPRSIRSIPNNTLEMALVADGVAPKDLYPLDLDRAFKSLDRIKSQIVWPTNPAQDLSMLQLGQANFGISNANRIKRTNDEGGGVPLSMAFQQGVVGTLGLTVMKGARNKDNAMKLVSYFLRPEPQVALHGIVYDAPVSKKATAMMPAEAKKWMADLSNPQNVITSDQYWSENFEAVQRRFQEWKLT